MLVKGALVVQGNMDPAVMLLTHVSLIISENPTIIYLGSRDILFSTSVVIA